MRYIAIFLCLAGLAMAAGYNDWQQGAIEGLRIGFEMGKSYQQAQQGINISGFNEQIDVYNSWVRKHFGEDPSLIMQKMPGPIDLSKPVLISNNTTSRGIPHVMDGKASGPSYRTNDVNLLPENVRTQYNSTNSQWLGGV